MTHRDEAAGTVGTLTASDSLMWGRDSGAMRSLPDGDGWRRMHDRARSVAIGTIH